MDLAIGKHRAIRPTREILRKAYDGLLPSRIKSRPAQTALRQQTIHQTRPSAEQDLCRPTGGSRRARMAAGPFSFWQTLGPQIVKVFVNMVFAQDRQFAQDIASDRSTQRELRPYFLRSVKGNFAFCKAQQGAEFTRLQIVCDRRVQNLAPQHIPGDLFDFRLFPSPDFLGFPLLLQFVQCANPNSPFKRKNSNGACRILGGARAANQRPSRNSQSSMRLTRRARR